MGNTCTPIAPASHDEFADRDRDQGQETPRRRYTWSGGRPPAALGRRRANTATGGTRHSALFEMRPTASQKTASPRPLSDLCILCVAAALDRVEDLPPGLPSALVGELLDTLTLRGGLNAQTLSALSACEIADLSLSACRDVDDGWLETVPTGALISLDLSHCHALTDRALWQLRSVPRLVRADLSGCPGLTDAALLVLGSAAGTLEHVALSGCRGLTDAGVARLLSTSWRLASLDVSGCELLTHAALGTALASCVCRASLARLDVSNLPGVLDATLASFRVALNGPLTDLRVGWCRSVTDAGLAHLGKIASLTRLDAPRLPIVTDDGVAALGALLALTDLSLSGCARVTDDGVAALSRLRRLRKLDVSACPRVTALPRALAASAALESLDVGRTAFGDVGVVALVDAQLGRTTLSAGRGYAYDSDLEDEADDNARSLRSYRWTPAAKRRRAAVLSAAGRGLRTLNLETSTVGDAGMKALCELPTLTDLNLAETHVTGATLRGLAEGPSAASIARLSLFFCQVGQRTLPLSLKKLTTLTDLNLDSRDVTDDALGYLPPTLEKLDMFSASVTDAGIVALAGACKWLVALHSCGGRLTSRALDWICGALPRLELLNLSQNPRIRSHACSCLRQLGALEDLNLSGCTVGPAALPHFVPLVGLRSLSVAGRQECGSPSLFSADDIAALRVELPKLRFVHYLERGGG